MTILFKIKIWTKIGTYEIRRHFKTVYFLSPVYRYERETEDPVCGENYVKRNFRLRDIYQVLLARTNEGEIVENFKVKNHFSDVAVDWRIRKEVLKK